MSVAEEIRLVVVPIQILKAVHGALDFYANPDNHRSPSTGFALQVDPQLSPLAKDKGKQAMAAVLMIQNFEKKTVPV